MHTGETMHCTPCYNSHLNIAHWNSELDKIDFRMGMVIFVYF